MTDEPRDRTASAGTDSERPPAKTPETAAAAPPPRRRALWRRPWVVALAGLLLVVAGPAFYYASPSARVHRLLAELRPPGPVRQLLIRLGLRDGAAAGTDEVAPRIVAIGADAVPALSSAAASDDDAGLRLFVLNVLGEIGPVTDEVVSALIAALKDDDEKVSARAARLLGEIGPVTGDVVPALAEALLKDERAAVRASAAGGLWYAAPAAKDAVPALVEALHDPERGVRSAATSVLGAMGRAVRDGSPPALAEALRDAGVVPELIDLMLHGGHPYPPRDDPEPEPWGPRGFYGQSEWMSEWTTAETMEAMNRRAEAPRCAAANALGWLWYVDDDVVPALVRALKDWHGGVRSSAAWALGYVGEPAAEAAPALVAALADEEARVRWAAAEGLRGTGPATDDVIPALIRALTDKERPVRRAAVEALGSFGPRAKEAVPALTRLLDDREPHIAKVNVPAALYRITGDARMLDAIVAALRDSGRNVPESAALRLGLMSQEARRAGKENPVAAAVPGLIRALKNMDPNARSAAAVALGRIGPAGHDAVPALVAALRRQAVSARCAVVALGCMGPAAQEAVPDLVRALAHDDGETRCAAAEALGAVGPDTREAVPALVDALKHGCWRVRVHAARALGQIRPPATTAPGRDAVAALRATLAAPDPGLRDAAAAALKRIEQPADNSNREETP